MTMFPCNECAKIIIQVSLILYDLNISIAFTTTFSTMLLIWKIALFGSLSFYWMFHCQFPFSSEACSGRNYVKITNCSISINEKLLNSLQKNLHVTL